MSIIQLYEFYRKSIYARDKIKNLLKFDLIRYVSQNAILLFSLIGGLKAPQNILLIYSLACFLSFLFNLHLIPKISTSFITILKTFKRNWLISRWLISQSLMSWLQSNYLLFTTSFILGASSLGILRTFQSILGISHILLHSIDSWLPLKSGKLLKKQSPAVFKKNMLKIIFKSSIIFIIIFSILILLSNLILLAFDKSLVDYIAEFRLFCIVYLLMSINYPFKNILLGMEKTTSNFYGSILSILVIIILGNNFINNYGLMGIIVLYFLSNLIILLSNVFFLKNKFKYLSKSCGL